MTSSTLLAPAAGATAAEEAPLLGVKDLNVKFAQEGQPVHAVRDVTLQVDPGDALGIVGESGSGKSTVSRALMGLISPPGYVTRGEILWKGKNLADPQRKAEWDRIRGAEMAMIWQEPGSTFNPRLTVGYQLCEGMRRHLRLSRKQAKERACDLLTMVGISNPRQRLRDYPHQFSGGMLQRVGIATAISCEPSLVIADEPTTALDVTVQSKILDLLARLQDDLGLSMIFITHDLAVVGAFCERVAVMYGGRIVEEGHVGRLFAHPAHPYTEGLLRASPGLDTPEKRLQAIPGEPPDLSLAARECGFVERCTKSLDLCHEERPQMITIAPDQIVACHLWDGQDV